MGEYNVSNLATTKRPFCAAFMLIAQDGKYLFVKRKNTAWMDGYYGLPSGKVERGEGFLEAAVREAKEEVCAGCTTKKRRSASRGNARSMGRGQNI